MYAVIRAGGKQYRVAPGDVIRVERFAASGDTFDFPAEDVLMVSPEAGTLVKPNGKKAVVSAQVLDEDRGDKIIVFKFKRKKQYKKTQGHRQAFTSVRITGIDFDGASKQVDAIARRAPKRSFVMDALETAGKIVGAGENLVEAVSGSKSANKTAAKKTSTKKSAAKKAPGRGKK